jgi:hypothetical protein
VCPGSGEFRQSPKIATLKNAPARPFPQQRERERESRGVKFRDNPLISRRKARSQKQQEREGFVLLYLLVVFHNG